METNFYLIKNAKIINEGQTFKGSVLVKNGLIDKIFKDNIPEKVLNSNEIEIIDATNKYLIPGVIDDHVHFREPGLTHKADIASESKAAVAGGVTSFLDMPNTVPQTTTVDLLNEKKAIAAKSSVANYGFYLGVTNENISEIPSYNLEGVAALKLFVGSSTGNMLVNDPKKINQLFASTKMLIAAHCEDNDIIQKNIEICKADFKNEPIPMNYHALIRNVESCFKASSMLIDLAHINNTRLHILHISTAKELSLLRKENSNEEKRITAETCPQYLWFDDSDYTHYGSRIKCNPSIKSETNKNALIKAVADGIIDVIGTDHAPHLLSEKEGDCLKAVSGTPQIEHSLLVILELMKQGKFSIETIVERMCHAPAKLFRIEKRGFIRKGYHADLVLIDRNQTTIATDAEARSKCAWTPYNGVRFSHKISHTFVNGNLVYENGAINDSNYGEELIFAKE